MKLIHLSDLHLGKRVNDFSMVEDQKFILGQILAVIEKEQPDAVVIAGDVYDKSVPSAEAVELLDWFLCGLSQTGVQTFISSGNHDSPERLSFGGRLMTHAGIHLSPVYDGSISPISLHDEFGAVNFYLLPFLKPVQVRRFFPEETVESYTDGCRVAIRHMNLDTAQRNVLLSHQFVTGAQRCESEDISVGGSDNVDASVFGDFDYVALGHIHSPQNITGHIRYCGTPLKYSFSEANHQKSVTVVTVGEKGELLIETCPLKPMRDMIKVKGFFEEITDKVFYEKLDTESYVQITLLDEQDIPNAFGKLATIYPNLMQMRYENKRTMDNANVFSEGEGLNMAPEVLFSQFYETMNNQPMTKEQSEYMTDMIEKIWEDKK